MNNEKLKELIYQMNTPERGALEDFREKYEKHREERNNNMLMDACLDNMKTVAKEMTKVATIGASAGTSLRKSITKAINMASDREIMVIDIENTMGITVASSSPNMDNNIFVIDEVGNITQGEYDNIKNVLTLDSYSSRDTSLMLQNVLEEFDEKEYIEPIKKKKKRMSRMEKARMYGGK